MISANYDTGPSSESQVCIQKEPQNGDRSHFSSQDGGGSQVSIATQEEAQNGGGPQLSTQELENESGSKDGSESWVSTQEEPQNYGSNEIILTQGKSKQPEDLESEWD